MPLNAAGLDVSGDKNPRWKGGLVNKKCSICGKEYSVKYTHRKSKYCSLQCVGASQRGKTKDLSVRKIAHKECEVCGATYSVPKSHENRYHCCSKECSFKRRANITKGDSNPNWDGGLSRMPYPWDFKRTSKKIMERDGYKCQNPLCRRKDTRLTVHHVNYDKLDCSCENLITLCSSCNSRANFGRDQWEQFYIAIQKALKRDGGGWKKEEF